MDTRNVLILKIYDTLGLYNTNEETIQTIRDKKLIMHIWHNSYIVSAITLLINNNINCTNSINQIPRASKRIDKTIFIVQGTPAKWYFKHVKCDHCRIYKDESIYIIRKSKSLWIAACHDCLIKILVAVNKLKIYYYTREINYKLLLMKGLLINDITNYIKTMYVQDCINKLICM